MKCLRCQHENAPTMKFCGECGMPLTANPSGPPAPSYAEITSALSEALEQQTATREILQVIASSPTDLEPVMNAVAESAARLCEATDSAVFRVDGEVLRLMVSRGPMVRTLAAGETIPITRGSTTGRAVLDARTVHNPDLALVSEAEFPESKARARRTGLRSHLATPLLRQRVPIGAIVIRRTEVRPFTEAQIKLLETFAAQAVIAIENVRLLTELQARNREVTESLEQQTATGEILRVISSSPTDVHPVFEAIAANAARVCEAGNANVYRFDGTLIHVEASYGYTAEELAAVQGTFPMPPGRSNATSRAVSTGVIVHVPDMTADPEYASPALIDAGFRTSLSVPMLRESKPIGTITVARRDVRPFSDRQISLLQTFAAQAVIAIENVRLFKELEARNRDLTEALEQQTATSKILRVISSSPTDLQPVMEAIAENAARVWGATDSSIFRLEGDHVRLVARHGSLPAGWWGSGGQSTSRTSWRPRGSSLKACPARSRPVPAVGQWWALRCCARARRWVPSSSLGRKSTPSPPSRSRSSRPSPTRPSSPSTTSAYSTNCGSGRPS